MAYEHKEGQGSLFKNEKQNDRQPDYKGTILIGGVMYEIAAWERTSQKGATYLSLQAALQREKTEKPQHSCQQQAQNYSTTNRPGDATPMPTVDDFPTSNPDDDLPF